MTSSNPPAWHDTGTDQLLAEAAGAVAVVTFNNPGKRNALSSAMRAALPGLQRFQQAGQCRAHRAGQRVVLGGVVEGHHGHGAGRLGQQLVGARVVPRGRVR